MMLRPPSAERCEGHDMRAEFKHLEPTRITGLHDALLDAGLGTMGRLNDLTTSLSRRFAAQLPSEPPAISRLLATLHELNRVERLTNGDVPLAQWLTAVELQMADSPQVDVVRAAMRDISSGRVSSKEAQAHLGSVSFEQLKVTDRTDMVPFSYLRAGATVGLSVARVQVPAYSDGQPVLFENRPRLSLGTGWLATADLLITNHHVVNCRDGVISSESDLRLQAEKTTVQFDYETPDSRAPGESVARLEAWSPMNGLLDYAVLRLSNKQDAKARPPLSLRRGRLVLPPDPESYPSLNIIQHPSGGPKMLAFRNNRLAKVEDTDLWYFTDTERGSSGSPVLDDNWQVVGLHKKWGWVTGIKYYQGKTAAWANVGTQVIDILADLESRYPKIRAEIGG